MPAWTIGKSGRTQLNPYDGYINGQIQNDFPRSQSISKFQRNNSYYQNPTPGPGAYESKDSLDGIQVGIRDKNLMPPRGDSPGPAAYYSNDKHLPSSPKYSIKGPHKREYVDNLPGPGAFEQKSTLDGPKISFRGKDNNPINNKSELIGPGSYNPTNAKFPSSPKWPFLGKPKQKRSEDSPGPGSFEPQNMFDGPKIGFRGKNPSKIEMDNLGPGSYNLTDAHLPSSPKWGMRHRIHKERNEDSPGPGTFEAKNTFVL